MADEKPRAQRDRKAALLPAILVVSSLSGILAIMAGVLVYLSPPQESENVAASGPDSDRRVQPAVQPMVLPSVGPGGPNAPLAPAEPDAPPPLPAVKAHKPIKTTKKTRPTRITIPKIGVSAPVQPLGLQKSGEIAVPPLSKPHLTGWYRLGPVPGEIGPAVILGHVNTKRGPAVFSRLREIQRGDKIRVARSDGKIVEFTVDGVEQISKSAFPTNRVYGNLNDAGLRLVSCGGVYNRRTGHYSDNIIVYATMSKAGGKSR
ncbi:class F sortase [Thermostaphylospora chromogena]|uniref:LPXTG-site transpeptidase (Sortase) family protein n=1 Tax=Thermostaphylospora chromogena TaxID=35622 RepID=A0A1H1E0R0_9ACTN|nr:class F sortase [Thermostaphylospora chromogena]SDQ82341.1 LPXTG-site transpeptidase (sortase) family protein [Thermostaphylospora chromogena]